MCLGERKDVLDQFIDFIEITGSIEINEFI